MHILTLIFLLISLTGCEKDNAPPVADNEIEVPSNQPIPTFSNEYIETDKAVYSPGDEVTFSLNMTSLPTTAKVRYKFLGQILEEKSLNQSSWKWQVPATDYRGYMAEVYAIENGKENIISTIAIDASTVWTKFPRYGFLSNFSNLSDELIQSVIKNLNRHHINGIQFYDWHNKHHKPMRVNGIEPASVWKDIANRDIYFSTVRKYISSAHERNIKTMFYNLVYGAWKNSELDGVGKEWFAYKDAGHMNQEVLTLPQPPFLSNIFLLDPSNNEWQMYLQNENKKVYQYLDFDGYHMDQLGDCGLHYTYDGTPLYLDQTFKPFIDAIKTDEPQKFMVMNAVNQYGQEGIATSSTDFLYTEVWSPNESYSDLAKIIQQNNTLSNNSKNTILAAYMNYDLAENKSYFNTPSVLMTDVVIFAYGGAHLELGEHMLGKEYFPNDNLAMKDDLKKAITPYYDFLVGYQNLLRDGGTFNQLSIESKDESIPLGKWPVGLGMVATVCKKFRDKQVVHFINFKDSNTNDWRDNKGIQSVPAQLDNIELIADTNEKIRNIWFASPDIAGGASHSINFIQNENKVHFVLPELKYWSMVVFEYE